MKPIGTETVRPASIVIRRSGFGSVPSSGYSGLICPGIHYAGTQTRITVKLEDGGEIELPIAPNSRIT